MVELLLIQAHEFQSVRASSAPQAEKLALIADMCRLNTLTAIKRAGSGHIGSSFSSLDLLTTLYFSEMNLIEVGLDNPSRDVFLSSKGHDAPAIYSVLYALGLLEEKRFLDLRRIDGVPGHPDIATAKGVEANTGSLGMGISKGRGIAIAKKLAGNSGTVFVLTGDGELQEGQNYEALQNAVVQNVSNICVLVDHNKVQSDRLVRETADLGDIECKFRSFGWHVERCNGNSISDLLQVFDRMRSLIDKPRICVCDTLKGRGVSFMEHPQALMTGEGFYRFHSGAPTDNDYTAACDEINARIVQRAAALNLRAPARVSVAPHSPARRIPQQETVVASYGRQLAELGNKRRDIVVLDADLAVDCGLLQFSERFPERFIECGIAEQDMVSVAGGLALQGYLPIVNSFGCFLASRAHEQAFVNATEKTKIIYVNHFAGLIPAGPGFSHQSLRDIALFGSLPQCLIAQPVNSQETVAMLDYLIEEAEGPCMLRLRLGPSPEIVDLPGTYRLELGRGTVLHSGDDSVLFCYGAVMAAEALKAATILRDQGFGLRVISMPWLNIFDHDWVREQIEGVESVFVLEDHGPVGGLGDHLFSAILENQLHSGQRLKKYAVEGLPACGTVEEVLRCHGMDADSLTRRIRRTY